MSEWMVRTALGDVSHSLATVRAGLAEGRLDASDLASNGGAFMALEAFPEFADLLGPDPLLRQRAPAEDTRLDMNPLIDVSLVLLIFFILTATYQELRRSMPTPEASAEGSGLPQVTEAKLKELAVMVTIRQVGGASEFRVAGEVVAERDLTERIKRAGQSVLALDAASDVPWRAVVAVQDAAAGAKVREVLRIDHAKR